MLSSSADEVSSFSIRKVDVQRPDSRLLTAHRDDNHRHEVAGVTSVCSVE